MTRMIACYGSLRKGFHNHGRWGKMTLKGRSEVRGYMTLVYDSYPELVLDDSAESHEVEIYEVSDDTFDIINNVELSSGYTAVNFDEDTTMWVISSKDRQQGKHIKSYSL